MPPSITVLQARLRRAAHPRPRPAALPRLAIRSQHKRHRNPSIRFTIDAGTSWPSSLSLHFINV